MDKETNIIEISDQIKYDESDDESDEEEERVRHQIKELEQKLLESPFDYQLYLDQISLLKSLGELEDLRRARQTFSSYYPLSPSLWSDWIRDEENLIGTEKEEEEREFVISLFERGVQDYVSPSLWNKYISFLMSGEISSEKSVQRIRDVFERAISSFGLHVIEGPRLWNTYRLFEEKNSPENEEKIWIRHLSLPLMNLEEYWKEYQKKFKGSPSLESSIQLNLQKLKDKLIFENSLLESVEADKFDNYERYIEFEKKDVNPPRIQLLYERRITELCLDPRVWITYIEYLEKDLQNEKLSLPVLQRSLRNCPWSGDLWILQLRAYERYSSPHSTLVKSFEKAMNVGFNEPSEYCKIWMAYIDYMRRRITDFNETHFSKELSELKTTFETACNHVHNIKDSDPEYKLARYWTFISAVKLHDMESARRIWSDYIFSSKHFIWAEMINLEKNHGDSKHLRKLFIRALEKVEDWKEGIGDLWLQFERQEGTLNSFEEAEARIKTKIDQVNSQKNAEHLANEEKRERKKEKDKNHRREKRKNESLKRKVPEGNERENSSRKRKFGLVENNKFELIDKNESRKNDDEILFKAPFPLAPPLSGLKSNSTPQPPPGFVSNSTQQPPPGFGSTSIQPPPGFESTSTQQPPPGLQSTSLKPSSELQSTSIDTSSNKSKEAKTVFLSNLDFTLTENDIRQAMSTSGIVVEVRLAKNPNGKSRGFAYVEFESISSAESALFRDREPSKHGRPMFISKCDPLKQGHHFKYSTSLEKNKLFVKNLNYSTEHVSLRNYFNTFGLVKDVRIVTHKNGKSKGLAFIEFINEVDAATAILKTDGKEFEGFELSVSLSHPPQRKDEALPSLGDGRKKTRSQVPFIPRSLINSSSSSREQKSNSDFRQLLNLSSSLLFQKVNGSFFVTATFNFDSSTIFVHILHYVSKGNRSLTS